jgi:hypothetical protein
MIERRPFSFDRETGIRTTFCYDHETDEVTMEKEQDCEPILENNKILSLEQADGWKGEMHKVASLPLHVWMDLKQKGIVNDPKRLRKWLNDRDNALFRTKLGRV